MDNNELKKLAYYMINDVLKIESGEKVLIKGHSITKPLLHHLIEATYDKKAYPSFEILDEDLYKHIAMRATNVSYEYVVTDALIKTNNADAIITIFADENSFELSDLDDNQIQMVSGADFKYISQMVQNKKWLLFNYPTYVSAYKALMSLNAFESLVIKASSYRFEPWKTALNTLKQQLDKAKQITIEGPETQLSFSKEGIKSVLCTGVHNLPDGEIYTSPVINSATGHITFNTISNYLGESFKNIRLTFEKGEVVHCQCQGNNNRLRQIIATDEGSNKIGEFAFGLNPLITKPIGDTLIDEKIRGSIHLALGNAFEDVADNGNRSSIHWDLVLMMKEQENSSIFLDDCLFYENGEFVQDNLKILNT